MKTNEDDFMLIMGYSFLLIVVFNTEDSFHSWKEITGVLIGLALGIGMVLRAAANREIAKQAEEAVTQLEVLA